jgi:branched-chain amino acid transport system substrate-binding protein
MRLVRYLACSLIAILALAGSSSAQEPIRLGVLYSLTGEWSAYGTPSSRGAQLYTEQLNARGGVLDRPLELIIKDTKGSTEGAAAMASEVLQEAPDVPALLGISDSDQARAAGEVAAGASRVFITSGATSPLLPKEVPEFLFLACFGDNVQAAAAAQFARVTLKAQSVAVLFDTSHTYTRLLQDYFSRSFEALGGEIAATIDFQDADKFANAMVRAPQADVLFVAAETPQEAIAFAKVLRENGFEQPILGGDGYDGDAVWSADPALKDIYFTTHAYFAGDNPSARARDFAEAFAAAHDGAVPDAFAGLGYDTVGLVAAAIEKAGSADPEQLLKALGTITDYQGVTGTISFVDGNHVPNKSVTILEVKDGKRLFVSEILPEQIPPP